MHGLGAFFFIEQTEPCKATIIKQCAILGIDMFEDEGRESDFFGLDIFGSFPFDG